MPIAGWPSEAAAETTSPIRDAPSSIEYSVCTWRWTNDLLTALWTTLLGFRINLWTNHTAVTQVSEAIPRVPGPNSPGSGPAARGDERHVHLVGRHRAVGAHQVGLVGQVGV